MKNLMFDMYAHCDSEDKGHPQEIMRNLGITYQLAVPQSLNDSWWFFNCKNIPKILPSYIEEKDFGDLSELIGYGLSKEDVEALKKEK